MTQTTALYRANAPITSIEAAESLDVTRLEKIVLEAIKYHQPCISDDVRSYCAANHNIHSYSSVTARFRSLEDKGLIVYTGEKKPGWSGRNQRVMQLTSYD